MKSYRGGERRIDTNTTVQAALSVYNIIMCDTHLTTYRNKTTLRLFDNSTAAEEGANSNQYSNSQNYIQSNIIMIVGLCHRNDKGGIR